MRAILFGRQTPSCRLHPLGNEIMLTLSSLRFCNQNSPFWFLESTHSAVFIKSCFLCFRWSLELTPLNLKFPTIILLNVHTLYLQSSLEQHRFELHGSPSTYFFFFPPTNTVSASWPQVSHQGTQQTPDGKQCFHIPDRGFPTEDQKYYF